MLSAKNQQPPRPLRVFLSYSPADKIDVQKLYRRLSTEGIDVWFNEESLLPGQDWKREIRKAVQTTDAVIVCLSQSSINTAGFANKEIKYALDVADEQPEGTIFLIPLKLQECDIPDQLSRLHWVNYFEEKGYESLRRALQQRATTLGVNLIPLSAPAHQNFSVMHDEQSGRPRHIICLVILPFKENPDALPFAYESVLFPALRNVLELHPYYWQVACSNDKFFDDNIDQNTASWMKQARSYIVDVSDRNIEVMIQLGNLAQLTKKRKQPLIVLERENSPSLSSMSGIIRISYPNFIGPHAIDDIAKDLAFAFASKPKIKEVLSTRHDHYLSPLLLMSDEFSMNEQRATTLSSVYITMESFVSASVEDICDNMRNLSSHVARGYQEAIRDILDRL